MVQHRALVLFAHPHFHKSRVNQPMAAAVKEISGVSFHDLYAAYPDFFIDTDREQELLLAHELIVLQFPLYWFSAPAIIKEWIDKVLESGWAYGEGGNKLHGKHLLLVISAGDPESTYQSTGSNHYPLTDYLRPFEQMAKICGLNWFPPFVIYGRFSDVLVKAHVDHFRKLMKHFVNHGPVGFKERS